MNKVYVLITLYNPNVKKLKRNLSHIVNYVDKIILLDNSETNDYSRYIMEENIFSYRNIIYYKMKKNLGLGAINIGLKLIENEKPDFILLLDQDSYPDKDMIPKLKKELLEIIKRGNRLSVIGPTLINKRTGKILRLKNKNSINETLYSVTHLPTSGMLIPLYVFEKIGYFCEELFLDAVDFEWCWRGLKKGVKFYQLNEAFLYHELGESTKKFLFFEFSEPSTKRTYYIFRNSIFVILCDYAPLNIRIEYFFLTFIRFFLYIFFPEKRKRIKYSISGIVAGIKKWVIHRLKCE